jgi:Transglycosylase
VQHAWKSVREYPSGEVERAVPIFRWVFLFFVVFSSACSSASEKMGPQRATFVEGLMYQVGAKLARHGIRLHCQGLETRGASIHLNTCDASSRRGLVRGKDITIGLTLESTWLPLFDLPTLHLRAGEVAAVRARGASKASPAKVASSNTAEREARRLPRLLRALPVRIEVSRLMMHEIPFALSASVFGWPFARANDQAAPRGEAHIGARDLQMKIYLEHEGVRDVGHVVFVTPSVAKLSSVLGRRLKMVTGGRAIAMLDFDVEDGTLIGKGSGRATDVCVEHQRFGDGRACGITLAGALRLGANAHQIYVDSGSISMGAKEAITLIGSGAIPLDKEGGALDLDIRLRNQPVQKLLAAIPSRWRTGLRDFVIDGSFSARLRLTNAEDAFHIEPTFAFEAVKVKSAPQAHDPRRLNGPSSWTLSFPYPHTVSLAPEDGYTTLSQLPQVLVDAVRISEDANFFGHDGFDRTEIAKALVEMREGGGARGASTISQQLAKNLYFDGDRNLTRKVEEAVATAALEGSVSKSRLLEIYLNIIEWGDGIFGIHAASHRYFGKSPSALDASEAAFLAGIIPAPRKVDREIAKNGESAWAQKRQARVTRFLCSVGKIPEENCGAMTGDTDLTATGLEAEPN